ncbi:MAG TPA: hypothetical protein VIL74_21210 [Pyrinomonadaceae bacterium]|jgi:hypothetical protein
MILTGAVFTAPVFAQLEGNPENFCRNGFFPRESRDFKLARVAGKPNERIYFYGDEREDCPGGKNCRLKSYLIPGDEVIVSRVFGEYACGWFQPAKKGGETVGWLKTDNLEWLETNRKTAADWLGEWLFYDNAIVIKQSKTPGLLDVSGDATWKGLGDNVHVGEIDESARPAGDRLNLGENETEEYACKVSMQFVGNYLVVGDNLRCGGVNVTFSGVYRKKAGK